MTNAVDVARLTSTEPRQSSVLLAGCTVERAVPVMTAAAAPVQESPISTSPYAPLMLTYATSIAGATATEDGSVPLGSVTVAASLRLCRIDTFASVVSTT